MALRQLDLSLNLLRAVPGNLAHLHETLHLYESLHLDETLHLLSAVPRNLAHLHETLHLHESLHLDETLHLLSAVPSNLSTFAPRLEIVDLSCNVQYQATTLAGKDVSEMTSFVRSELQNRQGRSLRSGYGLTTFSATEFFWSILCLLKS